MKQSPLFHSFSPLGALSRVHTKFNLGSSSNLRACLNGAFLCFLVAWGSGCTTNPVTGKKEVSLVSRSQEVAIGTKNYLQYQQAQGGSYETIPEVTPYVQRVGQKLVEVSDRPDLPYEFVVLNSSVPNAWALPGGKIAINRGLLTQFDNEAQLAAVIGHEIVHAAARHGAKGMERGMGLQAVLAAGSMALGQHANRDMIMQGAGAGAQLINQKYGRGAEREADEYGIKYMSKAGYDVYEAVRLQEVFLRLSNGKNQDFIQGLFASHPASAERVANNKKTIKKYPAGGFKGEKEYQSIVGKLKQNDAAYKNIDKGYAALKKGDKEQALNFAKRAIEIEPREANANALAAKVYAMSDKFDLANKEIDHAVRKNPNYFENHLISAQLKQKLGMHDQAKPAYEKSLDLMQTSTAHHNLGMYALQTKNEELATKHFQVSAQSNSPAGQESRAMLQKMGYGQTKQPAQQ